MSGYFGKCQESNSKGATVFAEILAASVLVGAK